MTDMNGDMTGHAVVVNPRSYKALQAAYDKALADGLDTFEYQGAEIFTDYAKYALEYMSLVIGGQDEH